MEASQVSVTPLSYEAEEAEVEEVAEDEGLTLEEISEYSVSKLREVIPSLTDEQKAVLVEAEEAKEKPRKSVIKLLS